LDSKAISVSYVPGEHRSQSPFLTDAPPMTMPVPARPQRPTDDPLDEVLRPPPDETPEQRDIRLAHEEEANRISLAIDASIKAERQARRKKRIVRLLLLGQSESGEQQVYFPPCTQVMLIITQANQPLSGVSFSNTPSEVIHRAVLQNFNACILQQPSERNASYGGQSYN
jgi:hypothetical protein